MSWVKTRANKGEQNSLTPFGNNDLNFRLARHQVVHLWNSGKFRVKIRVLFYFELSGITKHVLTGPTGNSMGLGFPSTLNVPQGEWGSRGNKIHCFPWGQSLTAYCSVCQRRTSLNKRGWDKKTVSKIFFLVSQSYFKFSFPMPNIF